MLASLDEALRIRFIAAAGKLSRPFVIPPGVRGATAVPYSESRFRDNTSVCWS